LGSVNLDKEKKHFIAYPKTSGFAWSSSGQMVFFCNEKYNFETLKRKPDLKKLYDWPGDMA